MSMNNTWAISSGISFCTSTGILIHLDMFANDESLNKALGRRDQRLGIGSPLSNLLIVIQSIYSFSIQRVAVVQRRERRFPNPNYSPSHEAIASPEAAK